MQALPRRSGNDHGDWNSQNLLGLDPRLILLGERDEGAKFSLLNFLLYGQTGRRVLVHKTDFPWLKRYPMLIHSNPVADKEGVAGYENGVELQWHPFELIPRAASEIKTKNQYQLLSVNEAEEKKNPLPARYVVQHGARWELAPHGASQLDLLTD